MYKVELYVRVRRACRDSLSGMGAVLPLTGILRWRARQRVVRGVKVGPKTARRRNLDELGNHDRLSGDGVGPPSGKVGRTEPGSVTFSAVLPGMRLSSGMGTVYLRRASPGMTTISLTKDWMKALRSVNSLSLRKSLMSLA